MAEDPGQKGLMTKEPKIPRISKTKEEDSRHVDIRYNGLNIYICPAKEFYYFEDDPFPEVDDIDIFETYELMKFLGYDKVFGDDLDEEKTSEVLHRT